MVVPTDVTPITNTPVVSVTEKDGLQTVVFDTTPALPSYLIAVAVGAFELVPIEGMSVPCNVVVPKGKSHLAAMAVETTPPLLAFLEDYFGQPYPFKKLDLIATNQSFSGAMEHPGAAPRTCRYRWTRSARKRWQRQARPRLATCCKPWRHPSISRPRPSAMARMRCDRRPSEA